MDYGMDYYGTQNPYWVDWGNRSLDILGARYGEGRYYSPDDPRFNDPRFDPSYDARSPVQYGPAGPALVPGSVSARGFEINWWTAALIGLLVGAFILGKGRR